MLRKKNREGKDKIPQSLGPKLGAASGLRGGGHAQGDRNQAPPSCLTPVGLPCTPLLHAAVGCRSKDGPVGGMDLSYYHSAGFIWQETLLLVPQFPRLHPRTVRNLNGMADSL